MKRDFEIYSDGLVYISVCSNLGLDETLRRVNIEHPTGISSKWRLSSEGFRTGEPNPCACDTDPETHKHYLFSC